jgi:signal-transduction protein with cAMP-binding, CBS, and nucleotidyltransferase domain
VELPLWETQLAALPVEHGTQPRAELTQSEMPLRELSTRLRVYLVTDTLHSKQINDGINEFQGIISLSKSILLNIGLLSERIATCFTQLNDDIIAIALQFILLQPSFNCRVCACKFIMT